MTSPKLLSWAEPSLSDELNCVLYCSSLKATKLVLCAMHCASTAARRQEVTVLTLTEMPAYGKDKGLTLLYVVAQCGHRKFIQ